VNSVITSFGLQALTTDNKKGKQIIMETTRTDAAGASAGTTIQVVEQIKQIIKVPMSNPSPSTVRVDAAGASVGTTTQRAESSGPVLEGSEVVRKA